MQARNYIPTLALGLLAGFHTHAQDGKPARTAEWAYGGNSAGTRYSPLKQINRENVGKLREVWRFDASAGGTAGGRGGLQTQPLVADGLVYANTPAGAVIALDGASGKLVWS